MKSRGLEGVVLRQNYIRAQGEEIRRPNFANKLANSSNKRLTTTTFAATCAPDNRWILSTSILRMYDLPTELVDD